MQYKWLVAILGLAMIAGTLGVTSAEAQGEETRQPLVQKIAERFNLKEADVQAVFDEEKSAHRQEMRQKFDDKLNQAVTDGKISEAQKQLITNKRTELKQAFETRREELKNLTPEERKEAMHKHRQELKAWAEANNIEMKYLMPDPKGGPPYGQPRGFGQRMIVD